MKYNEALTGFIQRYFRKHPRWHAVVVYYGLLFVTALQIIEDLFVGYPKIYSGEFYPWHPLFAHLPETLGFNYYGPLVSLEIIFLVLAAIKFKPRWTLKLLCLMMVIDNLEGFTNHRFLTAIVAFIISLDPVYEASGKNEKDRIYWHLDVLRFQISIVYFCAATYKLHEDFLSGRVIRNIFWMAQEQGMMHYPDWLMALTQDSLLSKLAGIIAPVVEFSLSIGLNVAQLAPFFIPVAALMHISFAVFMPYILTFSLLLLFCLVSFLPCEQVSDGDQTVS